MKTLIATTPFQAPTSPPLALGYLKAALEGHSGLELTVADWNLAFFRRWLEGRGTDLCQSCPSHGVGCVAQHRLLADGAGAALISGLLTRPDSAARGQRYLGAAVGFAEVYTGLESCYEVLLRPYVESRLDLAGPTLDRIFETELACLEQERPDVLGLSVMTGHNLLYALALGRVVRERLDLPLILGGALISHLAPAELLAAFPWLDHVLSGEAERGLPAMLEAMARGEPPRGVSGLSSRKPTGSTEAAEDPEPPAFEALIPDFRDLPLERYLTATPVLPIMTARGCYWGKCSFCSHTLPYAAGVRTRTADRIVEELETQTERHGATHFLFVDEAIAPRTLKHLSAAITERGLGVRLGLEGIRPERAFDRPLLEAAHAAGLRWVYLGLESATQRLLDAVDKGVRIEDAMALIDRCEAVGITPTVSYIIGLPTQTREELLEELEFLERRPTDSSYFQLLLGSPIQRDPGRFGVRVGAQEVLFRNGNARVHGPRFGYGVESGISAPEAQELLGQHSLPRLRPHLGEVHALLLADTAYFRASDRAHVPSLIQERTEQALSSPPGDARELVFRIGLLESQGLVKQALALVQRALRSARPGLDAERLELHRATCLGHLGRHRDALEALQAIPAESAVAPAADAERARLRFTIGDMPGALEAGTRMLESGLENGWIHQLLGLCHEALGQRTDARAAFERALERDPTDPEAGDGVRRNKEQGAEADRQTEAAP